jgi:hypothetical protein
MSLASLLAPISLPLASIFAIPMLSSWSTSLNLVFFSLTWTTLAMSYSPLQLEFFGPLFLRTMLYLLPSALFLLIDFAVPSLMVELKAQGELGLAARQRGGTAKMRRVAAWSVLNVVLAVGLQAGLEWVVTDVFKMRSLLLIKGSRWSFNHLPNPWGLFKHFVIGVLSRNVSLGCFDQLEVQLLNNSRSSNTTSTRICFIRPPAAPSPSGIRHGTTAFTFPTPSSRPTTILCAICCTASYLFTFPPSFSAST